MRDYDRVKAVIECQSQGGGESPSLDVLAAEVGLSVSQFYGLCQRWAGVSPEGFVRQLSAMETRRLLVGAGSVMNAALSVSFEVASSEDIESGGAGWQLYGGLVETPFGEALVGCTPRGICKLAFVDSAAIREREWGALRDLWPRAEFVRDDVRVAAALAGVFEGGENAVEPLCLWLRGTEFQVKVWRALAELKVGELVSYGELARRMGAPKSVRAVGTAVGRNPVAYLLPCHRVIPASGKVVGNYHWGPERKRAILLWERLRFSE